VVEGRCVAGSPGELGAEAGEDTVFIVILGGQIGNFLLGCLQFFGSGHKFDQLEHTHLVEVTNVSHNFQLVEVSTVVYEVEHEVVLHGNFEGLHLFGGVTASGHSGINCVRCLHEVSVLGMDIVDDTSSVNALFVTFPIDCLEGSSVSFVVIVQDRLELANCLLRFTSGGGDLKGTEPVVSELVGGDGGAEGSSGAA
jgi:hypothetical protein